MNLDKCPKCNLNWEINDEPSKIIEYCKMCGGRFFIRDRIFSVYIGTYIVQYRLSTLITEIYIENNREIDHVYGFDNIEYNTIRLNQLLPFDITEEKLKTYLLFS